MLGGVYWDVGLCETRGNVDVLGVIMLCCDCVREEKIRGVSIHDHREVYIYTGCQRHDTKPPCWGAPTP